MRLWTIQPLELYETLQTEKVLSCNPAKSEFPVEWGFQSAYDWLVEQMIIRVGHPPKGVKYPFWAWHTLDWQHKKPDLRKSEFRSYCGKQVCIELEIPNEDVLLSNEDSWHFVLNNSHYGDANNSQESDAEDKWFDSLSIDEQQAKKKKSWEKIFKVYPPYYSDWMSCGQYIQATFWQLRLEQVVNVRHFIGRNQTILV